MVRMILDFHDQTLEPNVRKYLYIILNSSLHLQNLIEDAMDMCRIENNKFSITKEMFDVRAAIREICEIMKFQVDSKGL